MRSKIILLTIIFTLLTISFTAKCQLYNYGQERPSIKWNILKGGKYSIIYPQNFSYYAHTTAKYLNWLYSSPNYYNITPKRIPTILHNDGGVSNGMVTWAPRVTNLYMLPPQNCSDYWLKNLVVHEFRHTLQMEKVNQNFTKGLYYILGDIAPVVVIGAYIPQWFLEGDAVSFETSLSNIGRGRDPEFLNELRAQIMEKGLYSYNKAVMGSYIDYVPNHYSLGYYLTSYSRVKYDNNIWNKALERVSKRPYGITPFTTSIKKTTGLKNTRKQLYNNIFTDLIKEWENDSSHTYTTHSEIVTHNKYYTNYHSPIFISHDSIIAYKNGLSESGAIVLLYNNKEETLVKTGIVYDKKIALHNGKIMWSEYRYHPRFTHSGKQQLCTFNIETKEYKRAYSKNNRYSPFSTESGWGCIEVQPNGIANIIILDTEFNTLKEIKGEKESLYIHPTYNNGKIYTVINSEEGNSIVSIDINSNLTHELISPKHYIIDHPFYSNNHLYFNASFNTNNAIYRNNNGKVELIAETKYGIINASLNKGKLLASKYTADGYKPIIVELNNITPKHTEYKQFTIADKVSTLEQFPLYNNSEKGDNYSTKRYKRLPHLLNIHSWGPIYMNSSNMNVKLGATLFSQNSLNTFALTAGYILEEGYKYGAYHISAEYRGWWPILSLSGEFGKRDIKAKSDFYVNSFTPRYNKLKCMVRVPLNFSKRSMNYTITPFLCYNLEGYSSDISKSNIPLLPENVKFQARNAQYIDGGLQFSATKTMNTQELQPKYGISVNMGGAKEINNFGIGDLLYGSVTLYAPGIFNNHGISLYGAAQTNNKELIFYSANVLRPRGVNISGYEYNTLRTNYTMPICYPDTGIGSILYFKRLFGTLFYDYGTIKNGTTKQIISSIGVELKSDFNILRLTYPLNIGIRSGYETLTKSLFAELLFSISISI